MRKIYKTPEVERQCKRIFKQTIKRFRESVTLETMHQLEEAERQLADDIAYTKHDPDYRSERFDSITVANSQTLFFERVGNDIVIVAAGWSGRDWKARLEEMEPYIDMQLRKLQRKIK